MKRPNRRGPRATRGRRPASALAAALVALLCGSILSCGQKTLPCADGSVFLTVDLAGAAVDADALEVTIDLGGGAKESQTVAHRAGESSGTLDLAFASYPVGKPIAISIEARRDGALVGRGNTTVEASGGCTTASLAVGSDGLGADGSVLPEGGAPLDGPSPDVDRADGPVISDAPVFTDAACVSRGGEPHPLESRQGCAPQMYGGNQMVRGVRLGQASLTCQSGGAVAHAPAQFANPHRFCPVQAQRGLGCDANQVCVSAALGTGMDRRACSRQPVGSAMCPPGRARLDYFTGVEDRRTCAACACEPTMGSCAGIRLSMGPNGTCAGSLDVGQGETSCSDGVGGQGLRNPGMVLRGSPGLPAPPTNACRVTSGATGPAPTPTGPVTFCCQ